MSLTQQQFINEVNLNGIPDGEIYVQIEETGVITRIIGLAVSVKTKASKNITNILEQVERVSFNWEQGGNPIGDLNLKINNKTKYSTTSNQLYFYFQVPPTVITAPTSDPTLNVRINFFPFITDQQFANSDFNATINSISEQKLSTFRQIADNQQPYKIGNEVFPLPSNIELLLEGNATYAQIPDSNYTKTGFINARYNGSLTDDEEFGSIPPGIGIREFQGTIFSSGSTLDAICNTAQETLLVNNLYHTGQEALPKLNLVSSNDITPLIASGEGPQIGTELITTFSVNPNFRAKIQKNMLLVITVRIPNITDPITYTDRAELVRVRSYNEGVFTVERNITSPPEGGEITNVTTTDNCQIYRLENDIPITVTDSRVLVDGSREVLSTDKFGFVTTLQPIVCPTS